MKRIGVLVVFLVGVASGQAFCADKIEIDRALLEKNLSRYTMDLKTLATRAECRVRAIEARLTPEDYVRAEAEKAPDEETPTGEPPAEPAQETISSTIPETTPRLHDSWYREKEEAPGRLDHRAKSEEWVSDSRGICPRLSAWPAQDPVQWRAHRRLRPDACRGSRYPARGAFAGSVAEASSPLRRSTPFVRARRAYRQSAPGSLCCCAISRGRHRRS